MAGCYHYSTKSSKRATFTSEHTEIAQKILSDVPQLAVILAWAMNHADQEPTFPKATVPCQVRASRCKAIRVYSPEPYPERGGTAKGLTRR